MSEVVEAKATKIPMSFGAIGGAMLLAGGALTAMGIGGGFNADALASSFMFGAIFWIMLSIGCLGLMLLFHITRGRWGTPVLRIFEAGASPLNLAFCFGLVILAATVFKEPLYGTWIHPAEGDMLVLNKAAYLNYNFFLARQVIYFALFIGMSLILSNLMSKEEKTGDKKLSDMRNNIAAPSMVLFFLFFTLFITDFLMSVDPHWYSTVWGFLFAIGAALSAMSFATIIVVSQRDKAPYAGKVDNLMTKDFGNLLLMLTMLWAYLSFSQLLIIWSGNLKEFIPYYLKRLVGNFSVIGTLLVFGQFLGPFLLLLSPRLKRTSALLIPTAAIILLMRIVDMYWLVMPYFRESVTFAPADFGMLLLFGGIWMVLFSVGLRRAPLMVLAHPYQAHGSTELEEAHV
ncbi:MAG: hypothetical protein ACKVQS_05210 [Fimbriimonadaceae bacterium]